MITCPHCQKLNVSPESKTLEAKNAFGFVYTFFSLSCQFCGLWIGDTSPVDKPQAA